MPCTCDGHAFGASAMACAAASSSDAKPAAATGLSSAYQRAASSASARASSRYSTSRVTTCGCENPSTRLRPRDGSGYARIQAAQPSLNLDRPRRFGTLLNLAVKALDQLPGERGAFVSRELKCVGKHTPTIHDKNSIMKPAILGERR